MGKISAPFSKSFRFILILAAFQLACTLALVGWWGHLLVRQSEQVYELRRELAGVELPDARKKADDAARMIRWEGAWFLLVVSASTSLLWFLFFRDTRRSQTMRNFFASITHELKTPLTSIRLQAESLSETDGIPADHVNLIGRLLQDTSRLENQVERSLELARLEGGGPILQRDLQLAPLIKRTTEGWEFGGERRVSIVSHVSDVEIAGDQAAIQTIVRNLVENSARHSGLSEVRVSIDEEVSDQHVIVSVADTGAGVDQERVRELGTLFAKGADSMGAGVGLYLVKMLMEKMGGRAEFYSQGGFLTKLYFKRGGQLG